MIVRMACCAPIGRLGATVKTDRLERIEKAIADAQRAGQRSLDFVDSLTDAKLIADAEELEWVSRATGGEGLRVEHDPVADGLGTDL